MAVITKKATEPDSKLDHKLTGSVEDMDRKDQVSVSRSMHEISVKGTPDYIDLKKEIDNYDLSLLDDPDVTSFSEINGIYAKGQSYASRISMIESNAIGNCNNWSNLCDSMKIIVREMENEWEILESEILLSDEVKSLKNAKMQQAYVKNMESKKYEKLNKVKIALAQFQIKLSEATAFREIVELKRKTIEKLLMNLTRQVKALSLELSATGSLQGRSD